MESETRELSQEEAGGSGRALTGERSPGGSVKRARERAAAALPPDAPPMPLNPRSNPTSPPRQSPRQSPSHRSPRPSPQDAGSPPGTSSPPPHERGQAPHRPPRPNYVPPLLQNSPPTQQPRVYWEEGLESYHSGYSSGSSRPSTVATGSSTASIPDFPQVPPVPPSYQPPPRRNLGPPPSARRGISSYYSQNFFVPPIPEEMSEKHSSYASSHVMPESWADGPPQYYAGQGISEEEEEEDLRSGQRSEDSSGRGSKASDYGETSNLVRGPPRTKPLQPFMEPIESGDESASQSSGGRRGMRELDWQQRQDERFRGFGGGSPNTDGIGRHNFKTRGNLQYPYSGYESDATFLDSPRSGSPPVSKPYASDNTSNPYFSSPSSTGSPVDPRIGQILGNLEKGGALPPSSTVSPGSSVAPSRKQSLKRPPRLNLEAPSKPPGRGSQSSLPELIRRATRLASNLDRGKTASRVGMLDMLNRKDMQKQEEAGKVSRDGSISDMLAAFPSPSPTVSTMPGKPPQYGAPSPHGRSNLSRSHTIDYGSNSRSPSHRNHPDRGRRCCGMPLWAFICLVIILMLLIALAVVIPITLIVIPRENQSGPTIDSCEKSNPCANGGHTLIVDKGCRCICSGGFYGSTCDSPGDSQCTTQTIPLENTTSSYSDATLGSSIPRLLDAAQKNYSIPLSGWKLAALFSQTNLSCTSENSLVIFDGQSRKFKHRRTLSFLLTPKLEDDDEQPFVDPSLPIHLPPSKVLNARASAQSSNGIVFASDNGPNTPFSPPRSGDTPTTTAAQNTTITPALLDFARTAVLFIFQETADLSSAQQALTRLAGVLVAGEGGNFSSGAGRTEVVGNVSVDLGAWTVGMGNGTLFGGRGNG